MDRCQGALQKRFCRAGIWPWRRDRLLRPLARRSVSARDGRAWRELAYAVAGADALEQVRSWVRTYQTDGMFAIEAGPGSWERHYWPLIPSTLEVHMTELAEKLRQLAAGGVDLIPARRRLHTLTGSDVDAAADALRHAGFREVRAVTGSVTCTSVEPLTPEAIEPVDGLILEIAEAYGLAYRGFRLGSEANQTAASEEVAPLSTAGSAA